jgi:capsular exopolysaccharide synthesis family protein
MSSPLRGSGAGEGDTLVYALRVVRERLVLIAGITVACGVLALLFSAARAKTYESLSQVVFGQSQLEDQVLQTSSQSASPERDAATRVLVATSEEVATRVQKRLKTDVPTEELAASVVVEAEPNADVLNFTASAEDPQAAADLANAFAAEYIAFERASLLSEIRRAQADYSERLANLQQGSPAFESVRQQLDRLAALEDLGATDSKVISEATPASAPSAPQPMRDLILGLIVGALLGLTVSFLLDLLDRRVKTLDDFERLYGQRALATTPRTSFVIGADELSSPVFEPYRILRTAISFAEARRETKVILVTSAVSGEGKTSVALNLVRAFAQSGQPAILVEADLRRPSLRNRMVIDDRDGGLTTALTGRHRARDLLRDLPGEKGSGALLLPAGPLAPNAPQLLSSARMTEVLDGLAAGPEVVVVDAAPLLPVADTQVLLDNPNIDATIIVGRAFETKREDIRRCRSILDAHECEPLGIVVTGLDPIERYEYYRPDAPSRPAPSAPVRVAR